MTKGAIRAMDTAEDFLTSIGYKKPVRWVSKIKKNKNGIFLLVIFQNKLFYKKNIIGCDWGFKTRLDNLDPCGDRLRKSHFSVTSLAGLFEFDSKFRSLHPRVDSETLRCHAGGWSL